MVLNIELSASLLFCSLPLLFFFFFIKDKSTLKNLFSSKPTTNKLPRSYPLIGSYLSLLENKDRRIQWTSDLVRASPSSTFVLQRPLGIKQVFTGNPNIVQHILKTHFSLYQKGNSTRTTLSDLLGDGIFNADGETWKFQRQVSSHEFNTKSLRKFVEQVVDVEISDRLIPILSSAAENKTVIDFQDVLQRFAFDNVCKIAFGYDPEYLSPSMPQTQFAEAFEEAVQITTKRFNSIHPIFWKIKRFFDFGSEKKLRIAVNQIRKFAQKIVQEKKSEKTRKSSIESVDLLSRFLSSGHTDENFVVDIVISFILAGRDTTSAALTWFFWLISQNSEVEDGILREMREKSESPVYDEVKDMVYTHAALSETMRLYPPVPLDTKEAINDDVLPDGTFVKKGMKVTYHPYAMGRLVELWGEDWAEFRPERWLKRDEAVAGGKWGYVARDPYVYPVFQAGPRVCLGKEMAYLQMKRVAAGVLRRFRVVPVDDAQPVFVSFLTSKMKGGFPVRIEERVGNF